MTVAVVLLAAVLGGLTGEVMRRRLNRLAYRRPPEAADDPDETAFATPGRRFWVPVVLAGTWAALGWRVLDETAVSDPLNWVRFAAWLAFAGIGAWLAVIDLDVNRLPDRGQLVLATLMVAAGVCLAWGEPGRLLTGLGAGLVCGLGFLIVHTISRGGLGLGDVKLIAICGWWLGLSSVAAVFAGVIAACLLGIAFSLVKRVRQFAFGPWLVAGTVLAGLT
ncbi:MAG: A24 family peptidase, partial [Propionibacteriaceae bacterium]|nr:A24 family peptidase [Propionibacteriaceae bacterium]